MNKLWTLVVLASLASALTFAGEKKGTPAEAEALVKERVDLATSAGKGWQNYKWNNPAVNKIENKTAYIEKCDDVILGSGAYK
jgi:signal transduction histidine kinase